MFAIANDATPFAASFDVTANTVNDVLNKVEVTLASAASMVYKPVVKAIIAIFAATALI